MKEMHEMGECELQCFKKQSVQRKAHGNRLLICVLLSIFLNRPSYGGAQFGSSYRHAIRIAILAVSFLYEIVKDPFSSLPIGAGQWLFFHLKIHYPNTRISRLLLFLS